MSNRLRWRTATLLTAACAAASAIQSCTSDGMAPRDTGSDQALVSLQVHAEISDVSGPMPRRIGNDVVRIPAAILPATRPSAALRGDGSPGIRPVVRHFRDRNGTLHSLGMILDGSGRPPEFVYVFEDGRISAIVGSKYERHGTGWIRTRSRVTTFDTAGTPRLQAQLSGHVADAGARAPSTVADALRTVTRMALPRELGAEEASTCTAEWLTYAAAGLALASASAALTAAIVTCIETGTTCATIEKLTTAWLAALAAWNVALDKLLACQWKNDTTSGGSSGGITRPEDEVEVYETTKTVQQFIDDAILSGNYKCTAESCIYYAA